MITIAIVLTIVLLPLAAFLISIKRADISTRPKHASFNLKRVRQAIAGWLIADVAFPWLLIVFGCDGREYMFLPLIFNVVAAVVAVIFVFTWAKKK